MTTATSLPTSSLCGMPCDIIRIIIDIIKGDINSLINLKQTTIAMNREISSFVVARQMLLIKLGKYEDLFKCVNVDCYEDTYLHIYITMDIHVIFINGKKR